MNSNVFIKTSNVTRFAAVADDLKKVAAGVPGMGLVHGLRGLGKTRTALWYAAKHDAVYLRAKRKWTPMWMMEELAVELMLSPGRSFRHNFQEVTASLSGNPRLILIDETDLVVPEVLETLRDVHDITQAPILLIGMDDIERKLKRFAALYDRLLRVEAFTGLTDEDIRQAAEQLFGLSVDAGVIRQIRESTGGNFRKSIVALKSLERQAQANGAKAVTLAEVKSWKKA